MKPAHLIYLSLAALLAFAGFRAAAKLNAIDPSQNSPASSNSQINTSNPTPTPVPADRVEVVHFHGNYQCWACITVGEYALQTIKDRFPDEYNSGKIIFKDINGQLPENQDLVIKYQARGSSLFINAIRGDEHDITEDITVWRLVSQEDQFIDYFSSQLRHLLSD